MMALSIIVISAGAYVLATHPRSTVQPQVAVNFQAATTVPFEMIAHGEKSTVTERVNYVITTPDAFLKFWKMTDAKGAPPSIDFSKHEVIAVFAGKGANAGIAVTKIEDTDARMVAISLTTLDTACAKKTAHAGSAPYQIVVVPATTLTLTHKDSITTASCPGSPLVPE